MVEGEGLDDNKGGAQTQADTPSNEDLLSRLITWAKNEDTDFLDLDLGIFIKDEEEKKETDKATTVLRKVTGAPEDTPLNVINVKAEHLEEIRQVAQEEEEIKRRSEQINTMENPMGEAIKAEAAILKEKEELLLAKERELEEIQKKRKGMKKGEFNKIKRNLDKEIEDMKGEKDTLEKKRLRLQEMETSFEKLREKQTQELEIKRKELTEKATNFQNEILKQKERLTDIERRERELIAKQRELGERMQEREKELAHRENVLKEQMKKLAEERKELSKAHKELEEERDEVKNQRDALRSEIETLSQQREQIFQSVESERNELTTLQNQESELRARIEELGTQSTNANVGEGARAMQEAFDLQSQILQLVLKKNTPLVLGVVKEMNLSKEDVRRVLSG